MNVLMMTNTYLPHVGGVARSVATFAAGLRELGHHVLVVAPTFEGATADEPGVVRVPAIQKFNGSDFSVRLPVPGLLSAAIDRFRPDVVHSHHPFLLGDTALRAATFRDVPLVFTHHTMYEQYTHYVPGDSKAMKRFVVRMVTGYANLCDHVVAPSESVRAVLKERGVTQPITAIPTGVAVQRFADGDRAEGRQRLGLGQDVTVVGHVGRLAPEKNLPWLTEAVAKVLAADAGVHFLVVGSGPAEAAMRAACEAAGVGERLHLAGKLTGQELVDAYHAMDVFAFASQSETQGMVLAEAMAAGLPVVAVDGPGVREIVRDGENGRLVEELDTKAFVAALREVVAADDTQRAALREAVKATAEAFSAQRCTERLAGVYEQVVGRPRASRNVEDNPWTQAMRMVETEWQLWNRRTEAAIETIRSRHEP